MTSLKMKIKIIDDSQIQNKIINDLQEEINILKSSIPDEMIYRNKTFEFLSEEQNRLLQEAQHYEPSDEKHEKIQILIKYIAKLCIKTNNKEVREYFYKIRELDEKKRIICEIKKMSDIKTEDMEIILNLRKKYYEENENCI
jgi:hypothetical protein